MHVHQKSEKRLFGILPLRASNSGVNDFALANGNSRRTLVSLLEVVWVCDRLLGPLVWCFLTICGTHVFANFDLLRKFIAKVKYVIEALPYISKGPKTRSAGIPIRCKRPRFHCIFFSGPASNTRSPLDLHPKVMLVILVTVMT